MAETLVQRLREGSQFSDDYGEDMIRAAGTIERLSAEVERLRGLLVEEREEVLWNAYHTGNARDGRWTHMFMSDGEWLARECGLDFKQADFDDAVIRAAIPNAARNVLGQAR